MNEQRRFGRTFLMIQSKGLLTRCFQRYRETTFRNVTVRNLSVKELPWCSKSDVRNKTLHRIREPVEPNKLTPIDRFGIVAAMSKNRIIGVNGKLPWNIPEDRRLFKALTEDKVLIIGRKTLEEESSLCHISHTSTCIVISRTLKEGLVDTTPLFPGGTEIRIVPSFSEALHAGRELVEHLSPSADPNNIDCWVAGGENVFNAAVMHSSARTIHLSVVDVDIDVSSANAADVARFPPKYHWDTGFTQASATEMTSPCGLTTTTRFTHYVFNRIGGSR